MEARGAHASFSTTESSEFPLMQTAPGQLLEVSRSDLSPIFKLVLSKYFHYSLQPSTSSLKSLSLYFISVSIFDSHILPVHFFIRATMETN